MYYEGKHRRTYVGWIGTDGNVRVASVDSDTGARKVVVLKHGLGVDDHNDPSLLMLPGGRLEVYYSPHSGRFLPPHGIPSRMYYRTMHRPEDVTSFGGTHVLHTNTSGGLGYTYPNPVYLSHGKRTWLFWRGGNWFPSFSTRSHGDGWASARTLIKTTRGRRPYLKVASNGRDTIDFAFSEDNPSNIKTGIYYARYRKGHFEGASGRRIGGFGALPLDEHEADRVRAANTGHPRAWVHDVASDSGGTPSIVYVSYPSTRDLRYRYAHWDGHRWVDNEIVPAGKPAEGPVRGRHIARPRGPVRRLPVAPHPRRLRGGALDDRRRRTSAGPTRPSPPTRMRTTSARSLRAGRRPGRRSTLDARPLPQLHART